MIFKSFFRKKKTENSPVDPIQPQAPHATAEDISRMFISTLFEQEEHDDIGSTNTLDEKLASCIMKELSNFDPNTIPKIADASLDLMNTLLDEKVSSSEIVSVVKEDPVMLGKLLKLANSAFYRTSKTEIESIEDAVVMLGNDGIRKLVISTLVVNEFKISSIYFRFFGANIWQHSLEVATMAASYAASKELNEFRAYLNGLLHDIGKLVIFKLLINVLEEEVPGSYPSKAFFMNIIERYSHQFTLMALKEWDINPDWIRPIMTYRSSIKLEKMDLYSQALFISNKCSELTRIRDLKHIDDAELSSQLHRSGIELDVYKELIKAL